MEAIVIVTRKYQITIPKEIREVLGIEVGDKLLLRVEGDRIVIEPIRYSKALEKLASIADRYPSIPRDVDAVKLVEESLERETGIH